jgi:hypothetical protein
MPAAICLSLQEAQKEMRELSRLILEAPDDNVDRNRLTARRSRLISYIKNMDASGVLKQQERTIAFLRCQVNNLIFMLKDQGHKDITTDFAGQLQVEETHSSWVEEMNMTETVGSSQSRSGQTMQARKKAEKLAASSLVKFKAKEPKSSKPPGGQAKLKQKTGPKPKKKMLDQEPVISMNSNSNLDISTNENFNLDISTNENFNLDISTNENFNLDISTNENFNLGISTNENFNLGISTNENFNLVDTQKEGVVVEQCHNEARENCMQTNSSGLYQGGDEVQGFDLRVYDQDQDDFDMLFDAL